MAFIGMIIGLTLLVLGILLFNPTSKWNYQKWFLAFGVLFLVGGFLMKNYYRSCPYKSDCTRTEGHCGMASGHGHCQKMCTEKCEKRNFEIKFIKVKFKFRKRHG